MSHSEKDINESPPEEDVPSKGDSETEISESAPEAKVLPKEQSPPAEANQQALASGMNSDPRFSRLMKMQSRFVTEESLRSTEEKSNPKPATVPGDGEEGFDDDFEDEDYDDDFDDDDFEDDDYEDDEIEGEAFENDTPEAEIRNEDKPTESPEHQPQEEDSDHRVAQLRKLRQQFVSEKDLDVEKMSEAENQSFKEVKISLVVCPNCQAEEPKGQKICGQCGARLPIILVEEEKYNPGTLNQAVKKYFEKVRELKAEEISVMEFKIFLDQRKELSSNQIDELYEILQECAAGDWLPDATKLIFDSTALLEDSMNAMLNKVIDTCMEHDLDNLEYDELLYDYEQAEDDDDLVLPEPPPELEKRFCSVSFQAELDNITKANDMMRDTLRLIDEFQKQSRDDLEVSM